MASRIFSLCAFMSTLLIVLVCLSSAFAQDLDYGIMIDAGSSGSRVYLYQWPKRADNTVPLVTPSLVNQTAVSMKINQPLSGFASNPSEAGESLIPLINYVKGLFDQSKWEETPLYLKATAGMRSLNQSAQDVIMDDVRDYLQTTPFNFNRGDAKVIPGTDEGIFGFVTTNYVSNVFIGDDVKTIGALDMGGASTQITFVPAKKPTSNYFNLVLSKYNFDAYVYSYPLGQDAAILQLKNGLVASADTSVSTDVANPCFLAGYTETHMGVNIVGTGNPAECTKAVNTYLVTKNNSCTSCGVGSVYQPPVTGKFYAFAAFASTYDFLKLQPNSSLSTLSSASSSWCQTTWEDAKAQYPNLPDQFLKIYCFTGQYFFNLLTRGYGFSTSSPNLSVYSSIGKTEITWALGAMIYEAALLPLDMPPSSSPKPWIKTTLMGVAGKRTGLVIHQKIVNAGTLNITGVMANITIGTKYEFFQFRRGAGANCRYMANTRMISCNWGSKVLLPKQAWRVNFAVAPVGTLTTTKASRTTTKSVPSGTVSNTSGWKATVSATGINHIVSAPLRIRN